MEPGSQSHPSGPVSLPLNGCPSTSSFLHHHNQQSQHASPITTDASTVAHSPPLFVLRAPCSQGGGSGSCSPLLSAGVKRKEVGGSRGGGSCMPSSLNVSRARSHPHLTRPQPLQLNLLNEQHHYMHMQQHNTSPSLLPPQANPHARLQHLLMSGSTGQGGGSSGPGSPWSSGVVAPAVPPLTQSQLAHDFASLLALHSSATPPVPPPPRDYSLPPPAPGTTVATGHVLDRHTPQWGQALLDGAIVVSPLTSPTVSEASWSSCPSPLAQPACGSMESGLGGPCPVAPHTHGPWCKGGCKASVMESHERKRQRIDSGGPLHQRASSGGGGAYGGEEGMDMIFSTFSGMTMAEHDERAQHQHMMTQQQQQQHSPPHRFGANLSGGQILALLLSKSTAPPCPPMEHEDGDTKATATMYPFQSQPQL